MKNNRSILVCLEFILSGSLFGCAVHEITPAARLESATAARVIPPNNEHAELAREPLLPTTRPLLPNTLKKIGQQVSELQLVSMTTVASPTPWDWQGEEFARAGYLVLKSAGSSPTQLANKGEPQLLDIEVMISRYASSDAAQKDVEKSVFFGTRAIGPGPKENYKGAALYRYGSGGQVVCQFGQYVVEARSRNERAKSLIMKALDVLLAELDPASVRGK